MTEDVTPFRVSVIESPDGPVIRPHGDMDMATADEFDRVTTPLVNAGQATMTIDMSDVELCDSTGINTLVRLRNACHEAGGRLSLASPQPQVRLVLDLTGLNEFLSVSPQ
jgi:anti-sigma B factor antagonist